MKERKTREKATNAHTKFLNFDEYITETGSASSRFSLLLDHLPTTIYAQNIYRFGGPDAVAAAGADIFAVVAISAGGCCACFAACCVPAASTPRGEAPFDAVHLDIGPALVQNELAKNIGRLGDAPPDSFIVADL